jgi:hypothetical protein
LNLQRRRRPRMLFCGTKGPRTPKAPCNLLSPLARSCSRANAFAGKCRSPRAGSHFAPAFATARTADKRAGLRLLSTVFGPHTSLKAWAKHLSSAANTSVLAVGHACSPSMITRQRSNSVSFRKPPPRSYRATSSGSNAESHGYGPSKGPRSTRRTESDRTYARVTTCARRSAA